MAIDFEALVARAMAVPGRTLMRPVVEKELLHYDLLFALDRERLLTGLTFQGGTSLRLCHGAPRFSEDLDFVAGRQFHADHLGKIRDCLGDYLGKRYGLQVHVKAPDAFAAETGIHVKRWQVAIQTAPARPDLPHQRIKLEIVNVPAYTGELLPLRHNYDFLPDGYDTTLIRVETLDEVMADKLLAYPAARYLRYRDIWDLQWLVQQQARPDIDLLRKKLADYGVVDYPARLAHALVALPATINSKEFADTMQRFLPADVLERTLQREGFKDYLARGVGALFNEVLQSFGGGAPLPPFRM